MVARNLYLTLRTSADERAMLAALAEKDGITSSDWVRLTIRRAYAAEFGSAKPPQQRRKR